MCWSFLLCLANSKREEISAERQRQSELTNELREETTIQEEQFQLHRTTDQSFGNEGNYADLMDRSFDDQQYSRLHIYADSSVKANANTSASAEYVNWELFIESMQLADDHNSSAAVALYLHLE